MKVLDFGIARANKRRTGPGTPVATTLFDPNTLGALTPAYASCEMIEGAESDPRDDIYAIAVVAYELLTGRHPFNKLSAVQARDAGSFSGAGAQLVQAVSVRHCAVGWRSSANSARRRSRSSWMIWRRIANRLSRGSALPLVRWRRLAVVGALGTVVARRLSSGQQLGVDRSHGAGAGRRFLRSIRSSILTGSARKALLERFSARIEQVFNPARQLYDAPQAHASSGAARNSAARLASRSNSRAGA